MRIVIGVIGVLAACVFIGQSAVTLGQTAYNMASNDEVWRQALMAAGASSVVIYEGIGLVFAGLLWHVGKRWLAFGCCLLVLAAAVYTVRLELAYNVTGQADRIAERQASTERRTEAKSDLTRLRAERDKIGVLRPPEAIKAELESYREHRRWGSTSGCTDATVPDSISYCAQYHTMQAQYASAVRLKEISAEIERIEGERNWVPVNAGGAPDAAWAARNFGGGEQGWADAFMVFGILFWVLARTLALPIAVGAMTSLRREPVEADAHGEQAPEDTDSTNVVPLVRKDDNDEKSDPDLVSLAVEEMREEGGRVVRFSELMNKVRRRAIQACKPCPSETAVGTRLRKLKFPKSRDYDADGNYVTFYNLGAGGAQTELAQAA